MRLAVDVRVRLLGTGSADGWPNPWCSCSSCAAATAAGVVRGQTSALLDDRVLVELGHDGLRTAARTGVPLRAVEAVLVTHAHPDHHAFPAWDWRGWASAPGPLTLIGPPAVLASAQGRLDPTVSAVAVAPGDRLQVCGYDVVALPANHSDAEVGPAVLYDITSPDGTRLLWATDTGPLSATALALSAGRAYDAVLLDLTSAHLPHHHDLTTWPEQIAELRRRGAVTEATSVCAIHLGHDNPPPAELDRLLATWGACALRDGDVLDLGSETATAPAPASRALVLGGARSGKSAYAEQRLAAEPEVTYLATAPDRPGDADWAERVRGHVARRPASWRTLETADVAGALRTTAGPLLVDDLGLWLTSVLDRADGWEGPVPAEVEQACTDLVAAWRAASGPVVLVAPEVGSGVVPATASGRRFRDLLGSLTARLAASSDEVVQVVAGFPRSLR